MAITDPEIAQRGVIVKVAHPVHRMYMNKRRKIVRLRNSHIKSGKRSHTRILLAEIDRAIELAEKIDGA